MTPKFIQIAVDSAVRPPYLARLFALDDQGGVWLLVGTSEYGIWKKVTASRDDNNK